MGSFSYIDNGREELRDRGYGSGSNHRCRTCGSRIYIEKTIDILH